VTRERRRRVSLWEYLVPGALFLVVLGSGIVSLLATTPPRPEATSRLGTLADPGATYDPVAAGEELPDGYRDTLGRDAILPVYDPVFVAAAAAEWEAETLVIGLALGEEAKAYPVSFLNRREMVLDAIAGIPVLVTW
jgi:hypothetical protein